jgi:hypothetical protein
MHIAVVGPNAIQTTRLYHKQGYPNTERPVALIYNLSQATATWCYLVFTPYRTLVGSPIRVMPDPLAAANSRDLLETRRSWEKQD